MKLQKLSEDLAIHNVTFILGILITMLKDKTFNKILKNKKEQTRHLNPVSRNFPAGAFLRYFQK